MGLFNSEKKEAQRQFAAQMDASRDSGDMGIVQQMHEQGNVAFDPQVSALILDCKRQFLPYEIDAESGRMYLPSKYVGLKEPISPDDIMSFLEGEEKMIVAEGYFLLQEYLRIGEKYGFGKNVVLAFNEVVNGIETFAHVSRMGGKNVKVSKSQYVEGSSMVSRFNNPKEKKGDNFLGGLLG